MSYRVACPQLRMRISYFYLFHFTLSFFLIFIIISASLALNENWDPSVRTDMESIFNRLIPEKGVSYAHSCEGPDDMPAHAKSILVGNSVTIPVKDGDFELGQWQGIYYCEHRDGKRTRNVVVTLNGALKG